MRDKLQVMSKIVVLIPARGGSKGIPGKNIKEFDGKPLLLHSIEYAQDCNLIDDVYVTTDDKKIIDIVIDAGASVIKRPKELSDDTATTESAIEHFLNKVQTSIKTIVLLQPTSPLRPKGSLKSALEKFNKGNFDSILSISPTHRFFWRVKDDETAYAEYDYLNRPRRQDLTKDDMRFIENGSLYIFSRSHFEKQGDRLGGKIGYVEWPEEYSYELDTPLDWEILENINKQLKS